MYSEKKNGILKLLYENQKLSTDKILDMLNMKGLREKKKIILGIDKLIKLNYVKRVHKKFHKPYQEYVLSERAIKYFSENGFADARR